MRVDKFSHSAFLHSPFKKREETWGKSHLAVACGTVTGDKKKTKSYMVPNNDPASDYEMRLAPDFFSFLKWLITANSLSKLPRHGPSSPCSSLGYGDEDLIWRSWGQIPSG